MKNNELLSALLAIIDNQTESYDFFDYMPYTMLTRPELSVLYQLTRTYYRKRGKILDLGCFLGGSTYALASGLYENRAVENVKEVIHSYDRFTWHASQHDFLDDNFGFKVGDSFLDFFKTSLKPFLAAIQCHPGDFFNYPWCGDDIEIMFIDLSKGSDINDFLVQNYFSSLLPGSVVIQQDFHFPGFCWLMITMEYFKEYFTVVGDLEYNSRLYLTSGKIPEDEASDFFYKALTFEHKESLMRNHIVTISSLTDSLAWLAGQLNLGLFYYWEGKADMSEDCLTDAAKKFTGQEMFLKSFFNTVQKWTKKSYGFDLE